MPDLGTADRPLRVAIIGAGPAGFYAAAHLLKQKDLVIGVDMYDRLPTPFGLVRGGVAPDHQNIKAVTRVYTRTAQHPRFRYFGNVEMGNHLHRTDLQRHYHQIIYSTGAQTDKRLGIPGEDLAGSHSATEFVAWYNGHPSFTDCTFDLAQERVAIVGVGNVAVDVARILCRSVDELAKTDIADYALEALRESSVREVTMLGRRGPAQAAFTVPEAKELGELALADVHVSAREAALDAISRDELDAEPDREVLRKVELIQGFAAQGRTGKPRCLTLRFLASPIEILDDGTGHVGGVTLMRNELVRTADGRVRPRATGETERIDAGLVFRSIGYRGVPLEDVPFNATWGVIHNDEGRVTEVDTGRPVAGEYCAGWIKRGPTGVIGTNKSDAVQTVDHMLDDLAAGRTLQPDAPDPDAIRRLLEARQPDLVRFEDWLMLDKAEVARGEAQGRPRVKFTAVRDMLDVLAKAE